jgi:hypothetical protein
MAKHNKTGEKGEIITSNFLVRKGFSIIDRNYRKKWVGHEKFSSEEEMYNTYKKYYGGSVDANTEVKIIGFEFDSKI